MKHDREHHRPRKRWIAAVLTLLAPGLGHVYVGRPLRGALIWGAGAALFVTAILAVAAGLARPSVSPQWNLVPTVAAVAAGCAFQLYVFVDAIRAAKAVEAFRLSVLNRWYVYAGMAVLSIHLTAIGKDWVRKNFVEAFWMPSGAMLPTLALGDHFYVDKQAYTPAHPPHRGDVVVFVSPEDGLSMIVMRVVAIAGDTLAIKEKKLLLNDVPVDESYVRFIDPDQQIVRRDTYGPVTVPPQRLFVLGDNRDQSYDSRYWGFVDVEDVIGRASVVYWSRANGAPRWERLGIAIR